MEIVARSSSSAVGKTENGTLVYDSVTQTDKDLFLKLLVAQMTNQDPFNTQDPTQYVTQLAQFNTLEGISQLNENIEYLLTVNNAMLVNNAVSAASDLVGKNVEVSVENENGDFEEVKGKVKGALIKEGVVYLELQVTDSEKILEVEYNSLIKVTE